MSYVSEFAALMAVFAVVIVAPGADFALVVRQSVVHGRKAALITSFGIGASLLFHISYTILGIGLIVSQSLALFALIKWLGVGYLVYLGIRSFFEKPMAFNEASFAAEAGAARGASLAGCFGMGFLTNALNPKPVLFFLSLFSAMVSHETPVPVVFLYGIGMASALIAWFAGVTLFFTNPAVRARFAAGGRWFNRLTGATFVLLGLRLAVQKAG
ncbi:RhtB (resistance to homoserine/threonine) family protein [Angulomicrobium tetraedrale]|uniref:RhtB (Resistance to homoserine/threonine) family protein n=1 Tax=Ancylobacter tetraedralis TaxID=217068 RepID=A0A839Z5V7_9HYPH|nr:LysE family transporter [Ancylobacter tetraedralis]MBB3771052.1 RhtB (resistance to homoserine/threonine) family protein [Ancylobacter tetraedralis]